MPPPIAETIYQLIENDVDANVVVANVVNGDDRRWLQLARSRFLLCEGDFDSAFGEKPAMSRVIDANVAASEVVTALGRQLNLRIPGLTSLSEERNLSTEGTHWPLTLLGRAKINNRQIYIGTGFDLVSVSEYWLAIADTEDPAKLGAYPISTSAIHDALLASESVFFAALKDSDKALAAVCAMDGKLLSTYEAAAIPQVIPQPMPAILPKARSSL